MAAIYKRVILPPSRTICLLFAVLLLFGTNVTLVILRNMMTYAHSPAALGGDFNVRFPAYRFRTVAAVAVAFGCSYIGNGSLETRSEPMKCKRKVLSATLAMDQSGTLKYCGFKQEYDAAIMGTPLQPLINFAAPCWVAVYDTLRKDSTVTRRRYKLRCLPNIILLGSRRSGVRDLSEALMRHPELFGPSQYEDLIWPSGNQKGSDDQWEVFSRYVDLFDESANKMHHIDKDTTLNSVYDINDLSVTHKELIYGVAPRHAHGQIWNGVITSHNNKTIIYLPSTLKLVTPNIKLIFMLRDPVERAFSDFCSIYSRSKHGIDVAKAFDSLMREAIIIWQQCVRQYNEMRCINDLALLPNNKHREALNILMGSLYSILLRSWLEIFPPSQVLYIKSEDYFADRVPSLNDIADFLKLRKYPPDVMTDVSAMSAVNRNRGRTLYLMWDKTRRVVASFFEPYNKELSAMLKDNRFLWSNLWTN